MAGSGGAVFNMEAVRAAAGVEAVTVAFFGEAGVKGEVVTGLKGEAVAIEIVGSDLVGSDLL